VMKTAYNRRQILAMGAETVTGLSLLGLAACGTTGTSGPATTKKLQLVFWGSTLRDKLTRQAIQAFEQKHTDVKITSQFTDFNSYWPKLSTQIAGGSEPDLIQMDMRYIAQYVQKGLLLDMTDPISKKTVDLSDFDQTLLKGSLVNGKSYGIPLGGNYQALLYDQDLITQANIGPLPDSFSWDEFGAYSGKLAKALGKGVAGTADESSNVTAFEIWVRQHGRDLYTPEGGLGFTQQDAADWFSYWSSLRKSGACVTAAQAAAVNAGSIPTINVVKGEAVFSLTLSNLLDAYQAAMKHKVGIHATPTGGTGSQPGMYLKTSQLISVSSKTKYTDDSVAFVGFLINNPAGIKAIASERGVPGSASARTLLQPLLTPSQQVVVNYVDTISKGTDSRPKQVLDPAGAGAVEQALIRISQAVGFGKSTVAGGASDFYTQAQKALAQGS
jgi:multiple sugar transport system substrate-binding protein